MEEHLRKVLLSALYRFLMTAAPAPALWPRAAGSVRFSAGSKIVEMRTALFSSYGLGACWETWRQRKCQPKWKWMDPGHRKKHTVVFFVLQDLTSAISALSHQSRLWSVWPEPLTVGSSLIISATRPLVHCQFPTRFSLNITSYPLKKLPHFKNNCLP